MTDEFDTEIDWCDGCGKDAGECGQCPDCDEFGCCCTCGSPPQKEQEQS